jgi:para-nitrobenzyl esterase
VNDGAKRPVLVSYHGGGWATGSGNGPMYDGPQMARKHNVVVVTVNHRLAAFGYLHLADLGAPPEFADAGNVGVMDMVASLQWGARQRRALRRRPRPGDDLRPVGRRLEDLHPAGDA